MQKIPTLFVRDEATSRKYVKDEVTPGCEWVIAGEGVATRKYDGTCVLIDAGGAFARREVKPGKVAPENFIPISTDPITGKTVGWEPMEQSGFAKFFGEAVEGDEIPGTYELCGPKINGNPEGFATHVLVSHADALRLYPPDTFDGLREMMVDFRQTGWEGVVWHHPDGRMVKLKARDFPTEEN